MFCVIQEINVRKGSRGNPRTLEVYESSLTMNGMHYCYYRYRKSEERFERPIRKAYRISVHKSYREGGKVRKKQTVICTINYYEIADGFSWFGDHVRGSLKAKADALGVTEAELCDMVEAKLQPLIDRIKVEYEHTEEYAASQEHDRIIWEWTEKRKAFAREYGVDQEEYDRCYDVFGTLRNPEHLEQIKADHEFRKEYERRSRENSRSYYENYRSNYGGESGYCGNSVNTHTEDNRVVLKKFYRILAKAFHPDSNPDADTSMEMKILNQLKNDWGV